MEFRKEFTGKEFDEDGEVLAPDGITVLHPGMGLYYFGKRYYDPEIIRWISVDPQEQFYDRYAYATNGYNPINAVDPDGEDVYVSIWEAKPSQGQKHSHVAITIDLYNNQGQGKMLEFGPHKNAQKTKSGQKGEIRETKVTPAKGTTLGESLYEVKGDYKQYGPDKVYQFEGDHNLSQTVYENAGKFQEMLKDFINVEFKTFERSCVSFVKSLLEQTEYSMTSANTTQSFERAIKRLVRKRKREQRKKDRESKRNKD